MKSSTDSNVSRSTEEGRAYDPFAGSYRMAGVAAWSVVLLVGVLLIAGCDGVGDQPGDIRSSSPDRSERDAMVRLSVENETPFARDSVEFTYSIHAPNRTDTIGTLEFGDGKQIRVAEGDFQNVKHAYSNDGPYTAILTSVDSSALAEGDSVSAMVDSVSLSVQPQEPEISLAAGTDRVEAGNEVTFTYSIIDPDSTIESAVLEFGDGESVSLQAGENQTVTHTYNDIGDMLARIITDGTEVAATSLVVFSTEIIEVEAGTGNITSALQDADPGVTIRLVTDGGIYKEPGLGISTDNITIEADEGLNEPPTVIYDEAEFQDEFTFIRMANPATRLTLKNFTIGREAGNTTAQPKNLFTNAADEARFDLYIHGMELRNVPNKIINNQNDSDPAVYDSVVVTRSYLHQAGNNVIDLKANKTPNNEILPANYVQLENVTIGPTTNQQKAIGFMTKGGKESPNKMELRINHVTMDKTKLGMNINRSPVNCSISRIENTVITRTSGGGKPAIRWNGLCQFEVSHMVTFRTGGFGGGNISSTESFKWEELQYRDPANGDYGLKSGAPGTSGNQPASDGDDRGDLFGYDDSRTSSKLLLW